MRSFVLATVAVFAALMLRVFSTNIITAVRVTTNAPTVALEPLKIIQAERVVDAAPTAVEDQPRTQLPESKDAASETRVLRVAFNANPPRKYVEQDTARGIAAEIVRSFAGRYGVAIQFDFCELDICLERMKTAQSDVMLELLRTPERETFLEYLNPEIMISAVKCFYQRKNDGRSFAKLDELAGLKVGVLKGYKYFNEFDLDARIRRMPFANVDAMAKALNKGNVDTLIGLEDRTDYRLSQIGATSSFKKARLQIRENILVNFLSLAKGSIFAGEKEEMENVLSAMYLDGTVNKVVAEASMKFRIARAD